MALARVRAGWRALARRVFPLRRYISRRLGLRPPPPGVNLVASIREETGLAEAARGLAAAMSAAQIPFNIVNYLRPGVAATETAWVHKEMADSRYDVTLVSANADMTVHVQSHMPAALFSNRYVIGSWFWELPVFPDDLVHGFTTVNEVWVASRYTQEALAARSPVPVVRIPPAIAATAFEPLPRAHFGLPDERFLFFFSCDVRSVMERKNPMGLIEAYLRAFPGGTSATGLVLKLMGTASAPAGLDALREIAARHPSITIIEHYLARAELTALMASVDCYVSLHRAEGFGLGLAEAMLLGKPVVATNWSGNTDFMTPANSACIDYRLVPLDRPYPPFDPAGQYWADPDLDHAAHWMQRLASDPALGRELGARGRETITRDYSPLAVGQLIAKRLDGIRRSA